ncbi:hypothetical protein [Cupriavidus basilensis]|uniref:hypothetical protein n=1 Tax=Cupriavidus basilensis TaxID=68895 RepID=UPI0020A68965|nr:hypothetical protein [Cupriavidus basilensis]MCP3024008.1 hypothetical protein [Cupriavidus basilensis]
MKILKLLVSGAMMALSQLSHADTPTPVKLEDGFRIGPYPIQKDFDGIPFKLWAWLFVTPIIEGRDDKGLAYKLKLTVKVNVADIRRAAQTYIDTRLDHDNCQRVNNVDNWVYGLKVEPLDITDGHTMKAKVSGTISTWTCIENPVFETVCDHYKDMFGISYPYNCYTRRGAPMKAQNFSQGVELSGYAYLKEQTDGSLEYRVPNKFLVYFSGDSPTTLVLNVFALIANNMSAILSSMQPPEVYKMLVPDYLRIFNPKFEFAGFERNGSEKAEFAVLSASISVKPSELNSNMRRLVGPLWKDIYPNAPETPAGVTKEMIRKECQKYAPNLPIVECASNMGWPYNNLPD